MAMEQQVQLVLHRWPWLPGNDVTNVLELNRYDVPLQGVFVQGDRLFLFHCLAGEVEPEQVWLYALITEQELLELESSAADHLDRLVLALERGRAVTLAYADDVSGVRGSVTGIELDAPDPGALARQAIAVLADRSRQQADALSGHPLAS
jgi:hypothetical protein